MTEQPQRGNRKRERREEWARHLRGPIHNFRSSTPEMQLAIDHIISLEDRLEVEMLSDAKRCHFCGHTHPTMASGTKTIASGERVIRYFCHESDHSCYQDNMGRLFK